MILITRRRARQLRAVFRRAPLGLAPRGPAPPLVFSAAANRLLVHFEHEGLAVSHEGSGTSLPGGAAAIALPLDALAEVEGDDGAPVLLETVAPGRTLV